MEIVTSRFGTVTVDPGEVIHFPEGLIGLPALKRFVMLDRKQGGSFKWLQSVDDGSSAFIVIDPRSFMPSYRPEFPAAELAPLELASPSSAQVYAIVLVPRDPRRMTANLQGPLLINGERRLGRQVVLGADKYSACHSIVDEMMKPYGAADAGTLAKAE